MKFEGTWLMVIVLSVEILGFGELEQSTLIISLGSFVLILAVLYKILNLIIHFIKKDSR
ncbi:hypothetical protein QYM42_02585 [Lactococcus lactis]|uniref:hypothetical protein n=1 Tax=Lactococcus lactis TaxID=1358 RepID=UPI00265997E3|nr:hypothetical protein [Lactococcus lactis]WKF73002.1 hypothetical protein QYM42_11585 [Lactococcus lactis]WKF73670.1 hypothetical protein QYM42_02585 [Lactococcus lactis]